MPDNDDAIISAASEIQRARGRLVDLTDQRSALTSQLAVIDGLIAQEQAALKKARADAGKVGISAAR